jgi:Asp/Glu/hydantoin racemase
MSVTLAMLHTSHVLIPTFAQLCKEYLPSTNVFHMVDESLIKNTIAAGGLTASTTRRMAMMVGSAREGGADAVMVTCSSIGPGVKVLRKLFDFPIFRIDEAMAEEATHRARRIGVLATLQTTLDPSVQLLREAGASNGHGINVVPYLCSGAFDAILAGDTAKHNQIVAQALKDLAQQVELIVLAQASMAGVIEKLPAEMKTVPILSSPELAIRQAAAVLQKMEGQSTSVPASQVSSNRR